MSESDGEEFSKSDSETGSGSDTEMDSSRIIEDGTEEKTLEGVEVVDSDDNSQGSVASRHPWEIKNESMLTDADVQVTQISIEEPSSE